jgi:hypothetical protein
MRDSLPIVQEGAVDPFAVRVGASLPATQGLPGAGSRVRTTTQPQVVEILVDGGYRPSQSFAFANVPLRLVFRRRDAEPCTQRVVFSSPHIERHLAPHGTTMVDLPAQPPGTVRFTCGMGRYRGEIELIERGHASFARSESVRLAAGASAVLAVLALLVVFGAFPLPATAALAALVAVASVLLAIARRPSSLTQSGGLLPHPRPSSRR